MNWEFKPHTILLRKERKECMVGRGRPTKSAETRDLALGFKEDLKYERVLVTGNG
jgi:hypothetical protein